MIKFRDQNSILPFFFFKKNILYLFPSSRNGNFTPLRFAPHRFFPSRKGSKAGMRQDFSPVPRGGDGFRHFKPTPSYSALLRVIIVNFSYPKTLLFKQTYQFFFSTQYSSLPLFCYVFYYEFFFFWSSC